MTQKHLFTCLLSFIFAFIPAASASIHCSEPPDYYIAAYWAKNSPNRFMEIITQFSPELRNSYLVALTGGYILSRYRFVHFAVEGQAVLHSGMMNHLETNLILIARFMHFPWDQWLDTRIAIGDGLSYAFSTPYLEPRRDPDHETSRRLLNYLMVEIEFVLPIIPKWSTFIRVHHRSGVYGLFGGVAGGSNFIGGGIRFCI